MTRTSNGKAPLTGGTDLPEGTGPISTGLPEGAGPIDMGTPVRGPESGVEDGPHPGRPLFAPAEQEAFAARIQQAVTGFVEDPQRAVQEADATFDEVVASLGKVLEERGRRLRAYSRERPGHRGGDRGSTARAPALPRPDGTPRTPVAGAAPRTHRGRSGRDPPGRTGPFPRSRRVQPRITRPSRSRSSTASGRRSPLRT